MNHTLYLLPGRGDALDGLIATEFRSRGYELVGRELRGAFDLLNFVEQVAAVRDDLEERFWTSDSMIVGFGFGAHLLLTALMRMPAYPGTLLLFNPEFQSARQGLTFNRVPMSQRLVDCIEANRFPTPTGSASIVSVRGNWQIPEAGVAKLATVLNGDLRWIDAGRDLTPELIRPYLDQLALFG